MARSNIHGTAIYAATVLNYFTDAIAHPSAHFGRGSGLIQFDDVACSGSELRLVDCRRRQTGHNCNHNEDAAVTCNTTSECATLYHTVDVFHTYCNTVNMIVISLQCYFTLFY